MIALYEDRFARKPSGGGTSPVPLAPCSWAVAGLAASRAAASIMMPMRMGNLLA